MKPIFWLFCTVIDNFGDIGVSWRLANEIQKRFNAEVHLWLDNPAALHTIVPKPNQYPIHLHTWQEKHNIHYQSLSLPHVIIETFACTLPENVLNLIKTHSIIWLNWEYLSAEDWAVRSHAMLSLQHNGSAKYFWQMGFTENTGGLLREANYTRQHQHSSNIHTHHTHHTLRFYLFGYHSPIWAKWFECWQECNQTIEIQLSGTQIIHSLKNSQWLPEKALIDHPQYHKGCLKLTHLPFVPQEEFDKLLWSNDILFIRGEDSFVRAQYTGKPFFWHIYPQQQLIHLEKLHAFWQRTPIYQQPNPIQTAFHALSEELNGGTQLSNEKRIHHWQTLFQHLTQWQQLSQQWQNNLLQQTDAVTRLKEWLSSQGFFSKSSSD